MGKVVIIEDESHAEWQDGQYLTIEEALEELKRRSTIPWNQSPNCCPCTSWQTCGREYYIVEFDDSSEPWEEIRRVGSLQISAKGVVWTKDLKKTTRV